MSTIFPRDLSGFGIGPGRLTWLAGHAQPAAAGHAEPAAAGHAQCAPAELAKYREDSRAQGGAGGATCFAKWVFFHQNNCWVYVGYDYTSCNVRPPSYKLV